MTASEKLQTLETEHSDRAEAVSPGYADAWLLATIKSVLPDLVAVVENAQGIFGYIDHERHGQGPTILRLRAALAELERKLP